MTNKKSLNIIWGIIVLVILNNCSPSSYTERYSDKEDASEKQKHDKLSNENFYKNINISALNINAYDFKKEYENKKLNNITTSLKENLIYFIIYYIGTPYKYGGNNLNGIDCSGFTTNVYKNALNYKLPRTAREQFSVGENVEKYELKFGDLVFFDTQINSFPGHVGIYIGDNSFVHSSSKNGVIISSLETNYYNTKYVGARRIFLIE
ncbi:MAG: C40 family peptidase [Ignavibacteriales bacterium]|nr:C40 family peptidase [Ignavibacteriales bacterium]